MVTCFSHIYPTFRDSPALSRRAVGICAEAIGPIVFSHTYDSNGNLTSDPDAGLTGMTYNALNLLSGYTVSATGAQTSLKYTASGEKTAELTNTNTIVSGYRYYFGNLFYDGSLSPTRLMVDGGYVDIQSGNTYSYRFYVQDHQGNNRMVTDANGTVLQVNHYDPYGQLLAPISSTTAVSQYKYGSKEWRSATLSYDFGARNYLPAVPRWNSMDPLAEKYYSISPYVYCAGNPVNLVDLDGESTKVKKNEDGTYEVVDVDLSDKSNKIYVVEYVDGEWRDTKEIIGYSASLYSFINDDDVTPMVGAIINPNDFSGISFMEDLMSNLRPLVNYMIKGLPYFKYDFKRTNGRWKIQFKKQEIDFYRAMPIHSFSRGRNVYGTARDIGNMLAGYYAAAYGITWDEARPVFDALNQGKEPKVSTEAQRYGYRRGTQIPYNERIQRRNFYCALIGISNAIFR